MASHTEEAVPNVNSEADVETTPSLKDYVQKAIQKIIDVSSSSEEDDTEELEDVDGQSHENSNNQLVVYDPRGNNNINREIEPNPAPIQCRNPTVMRCISRAMSRVLPSVGAFTVQCANCFKWRLIPTQEKYEEIREHILERPFYCETAQEWRPTVSCDDPEDISQDGSRLWAIDKPNIAQPPRGWQRLLHIRGEGCSKFADVYYAAPSGKRLRSIVEIQKYLADHPEYAEGLSLSQFSFQTPKPLQENYVRKRPPRITAQADNSRLLQPKEVTPLSIVGPDNINLELGMPSSVSVQEPGSDDVGQPAKKARTEWKDMYCDESTAYKQRQAMVGEGSQSVNEGLSL
ncbi:Methyl-CpG-binding domain-containing protein 2 [Linum grandiflorum]